MPGAVTKKDILDIQGLDQDRTNVIETLKAIAAAAVELSKTLGDTKGLKDLTASLKSLNQVQAEFTRFQKQSVDMAVKAERIKQQEAQTTIKNANAIKAEQQAIAAETQVRIKNSNAIKAEQQAIAAETQTTIKNANAIKAEQQAIAAETQVRIKNSQAIAAEERATQAGIRTKRLEQAEHKKTTSSFTRLAYSLRTYIAAYVSLQTIMSGVSSVFKQTKELDSLSFSMKTIIKDANELAQTQVFLSDTAKNYGLDLLSISERYVRFRAATIQSNMTAKDTQKIFDSVSRAAAVLGLRTDEVSGVYLALEQMISKGKVSTEELRRQLGERLSGAFGIFAAAIGVSTIELDKMLKKGQILSADVLPKFADQLLKAYGIENITRVDNLAAAQGRLNTSWTEFIKSLEASKTFAGIFNILADSLQRVNNAIKSDSNKTTERSVKLISESVDKLSEGATVQERQAILTQQILDLEQKRGKISAQLVKDESKRPGFLEKTVSGLNQALGLGGQFTSSIMFEQVFQDTVLDEKAYKEAIDNLKKNFNKLVIPPIKTSQLTGETDAERKARIKAEKEAAKELKKSKEGSFKIALKFDDELLDLTNASNKEALQLVKDTNRSIKESRKEMTDFVIGESMAQADEEKLSAQESTIEKIKAAKNNKDEIEKIQHELTLFMIDEDIKAQQRILDSAGLEADAYANASERIRRLRLQRGEEDIQFTQQTEEQKKSIRNETMQATNELLQQGLSFSQQIYSQQATRAEELRDAEMNAAGDSLEYQTLAKRKFEAEDKKIKQRQAIASKLQAVLDAGLALALAIATTWKNPLLAALNIGAATLGLGMALATPIPQFAEGTNDSPDTFIAGEEGSELIKTKSGKSILTPNSATLFSDPSLAGSTVIPSDETRRMLANMAFNQVREVVDMTDTNKHLSGIEKNTRNKSERYTDSKGRTVVKRGNLVSTL